MNIQDKLLKIVLNYVQANLSSTFFKEPSDKGLLCIFLKRAVELDEEAFLNFLDSFYQHCHKQRNLFNRYLIQIGLLINKLCLSDLRKTCKKLTLSWIDNLENNDSVRDAQDIYLSSKKNMADNAWRYEEHTCLEVKNWYPEHAFYYELLTNPQLSDDYKWLFVNNEKLFVSLLKMVRIYYLSIDIFFNKDIRFIAWLLCHAAVAFSFIKEQQLNLDDLYKIDSKFLDQDFDVISELEILISHNICSFADFIALSFEEQDELLTFSNSYAILIPKIVALAEFLTFSKEIRGLLLKYLTHAFDLFNASIFRPEEFKYFSPKTAEEILEHSPECVALNKVGFPVKTLFLEGRETIRQAIFKRAKRFALLYKKGVSLAYFEKLTEEQRHNLFDKAVVFKSLVEDGITARYLLQLTQEQLCEFLINSSAAVSLYKKNISLAYLQSLKAEHLSELFAKEDHFVLLSKLCNLKNFFTFEPEIRKEIFEFRNQIAWLAEFGNLTLAELLDYSKEERQIIYEYYEILAILIIDNSVSLNTFVKKPENLELELTKNLNETNQTTSPLTRDQFIEKYKAEMFFCFSCGLFFKQWRKDYPNGLRQRFLQAGDDIQILLKAGASLKSLAGLDEARLAQLAEYAGEIVELKENGVAFAQLIEQKQHLETIILPNLREILILLSDKSIFFSDLFKPSIINKLPNFFKKIETVKALIHLKEPGKVSLVKMVEFLIFPDKLDFIFKHLDAIEEIIEKRKFSLTEMLEIDEGNLCYFFNDINKTLALLSHYGEGKFVKAIRAINNLDPGVHLFQFPLNLQVAFLKYYPNACLLLKHYRAELREGTQSFGFYPVIGFKALFDALTKIDENLVFNALAQAHALIEKFPTLSSLEANDLNRNLNLN